MDVLPREIPTSARFRRTRGEVRYETGVKDVPIDGMYGYVFYAIKDGREWYVIENSRGLAIGGPHITRTAAVERAKSIVASRGVEDIKATIEKNAPITDEEHRAAFDKAKPESAVYSPAQGAVNESDWLSVGAIMEPIEQLLKQFATDIPVTVADRETDIIPGEKPSDDWVSAGLNYHGCNYLIREGLGNRGGVVRTLCHAMLQFDCAAPSAQEKSRLTA